MAFTTTTGSGGTSLIGTSGVDIANVTPSSLTSAVFIGAQGANDVVNLQTNQAINYTVFMGTGNDIVTTAGLKGGSVKLDDGNDTITLANTTETTTVSGLNGIDTINIGGTVASGLINGNAGNDIITVGATMTGGTVAGGGDSDTINVNVTNNGGTAALNGGAKINGQDGADQITINAMDVAMSGATIFGGQGSDNIDGSAIGNVALILSGDLGNDTISGGAGTDTIYGGDGDDNIASGNRADRIITGSGADTIAAGNNSNANASAGLATNGTFATTDSITWTAAASVDVVTDFTGGLGGDRLNVGGTYTLAYNATTGASVQIAANTIYAVSGTFNNNVFTVAASNSAGADTLIMSSGANGDFLAINTGVVLLGTNASTLIAGNVF